MPYSALGPLSIALTAILQDTTLQAATTGGWWEDIPQGDAFPYGWYEIGRDRSVRGFGTGEMSEIELRTHVFSAIGTMSEAQEIDRLVRSLLKDASLTVTGYRQAGQVFYDETVMLRDAELNGVKVHEVVSFFRIYLEV
jgi:hypothetical protein